MRKIISSALFLILIFCFTKISSAKILYDWSGCEVGVEIKRIVQERVEKVAAQYKSSYGNLGPYDFVNSNQIFTVSPISDYAKENGGASAEYFPGPSAGGTFFVDPSNFDKPELFEFIALHEFGHAYDYTMTDQRLGKTRYFTKKSQRDYLLAGERRAKEREDKYRVDSKKR